MSRSLTANKNWKVIHLPLARSFITISHLRRASPLRQIINLLPFRSNCDLFLAKVNQLLHLHSPGKLNGEGLAGKHEIDSGGVKGNFCSNFCNKLCKIDLFFHFPGLEVRVRREAGCAKEGRNDNKKKVIAKLFSAGENY